MESVKADYPFSLVKLSGRQKRPMMGDLFRVQLTDNRYFFGLVLGEIAIGPVQLPTIAAVIFSGSSESGRVDDFVELTQRELQVPPQLLSQRPWTTGYAQKIGHLDVVPEFQLIFRDPAFEKWRNEHGDEIGVPPPGVASGIWGMGDERTLSDELMASLGS